ALQETFFRVHEAFDRFDATRPFRPWLFKIARNVALDLLRARRKTDPLPDALSSTDVVVDVSRREEVTDARAALADLPGEMRALPVERHVGGLTVRELAQSWECSERTIVTRLREAAGLLAQAIAMRRRRR